MSRKGKRASRQQLQMIEFQESLTNKDEEMKQNIEKGWQSHRSTYSRAKTEMDKRISAAVLRLETKYAEVKAKVYDVGNKNVELRERIAEQQALKERLQNSLETDHLEVSAEIDLELKLQQRATELQMQLGESQRRLDGQLAKKVRLKKAYLRNINEYKKLKAREEERGNTERAKQKKRALERRKKELEDDERRAQEALRDPRNKHKALLAAAGHLTMDSQVQKPTSFYQHAVVTPSPVPALGPGQVMIDNAQYDEGIWLENNIRTLLSTGNYTDDDMVIRGLRAQLLKLRCE